MKEKKARKKSEYDREASPNTTIDSSSPEKMTDIPVLVATNEKQQNILENCDEPTLTEIIIESYEGEKVDGHFEGIGKAKFINGNTYEGMFVEGMMHGNGVFTWIFRGIVYEGDFFQNQITGSGLFFWPDGSTYDGQVMSGIRHGTGTFRYPSGISYVGEWKNGKRYGLGRMNYVHDDSSFYEGEWRENIRHGQGFRQYPTGNTYKGSWYNGLRHGSGLMHWLDRDEMYDGQWEDGVQHGVGQHTWFVRRVKGSQYPLRNVYDGDFVQGKRQGFGIFYYPNGARYEGYWHNNMKHGQGKFIFKNGRVYEGEFVNDKMAEFPDFSMSGRETPDMERVRTRTPTLMELADDNNSIHSRGSSAPTFSPSFQLYTQHIFLEMVNGDECDIEEERNQIMGVLLRNYSVFRRVYDFYSRLGSYNSKDNTFVMNQMQFWRFLKDCKLHEGEITLTEIDRVIAHAFAPNELASDLHNPSRRILYFQFVNFLVTIAFHFYGDTLQDKPHFVAESITKFVRDNVLPWAGKVQGAVFKSPEKAAYALKYVEGAYEVYRHICRARKPDSQEIVLTLRQFLVMMNNLGLINENLTASTVVQILSADDPRAAAEDFTDLEREMTFLEYFEALVGCAPFYANEAIQLQLQLIESDVRNALPDELEDGTRQKEDPIGGALSNASPAVSAVSSAGTVTEDKKVTQEAQPEKKTLSEESKPPVSERGSRKSGPAGSKVSPVTASNASAAATGGGSRSQRGQKTAATTSSSNAANVTPAVAALEPDKGTISASVLGMNAENSEKPGDDTENTQQGDNELLVSAEQPAAIPENEEERKTRELELWFKQIDYFFMDAYFPAANQYNFITMRLLKGQNIVKNI